MDPGKLINHTNLPKHIAVIMDGNGRWAKKRGAVRVFGHRSAVKAVRETAEACAEIGIKYLTLYAFSTENQARPKTEVNALMSLLARTLSDETATLLKNNIKLRALGNTAALPKKCREELEKAILATQDNTGTELILALHYSGRWDIVEATKKIINDALKGKISAEEVSEELFSEYLPGGRIPDPELMIRAGGEMRISNFLLWQAAYTEIYFTDVLWPDFRKKDIFEAVSDFLRRERRFGMISEQLNA